MSSILIQLYVDATDINIDDCDFQLINEPSEAWGVRCHHTILDGDLEQAKYNGIRVDSIVNDSDFLDWVRSEILSDD